MNSGLSNNNRPIFSIVIPTYNSINTIERCIESILNQVFDSFEIIIVDGKSNDGSVELIEQFIKSDSRIFSLSEKDKGIYDAMNKGIKIARGKWIYFLGADDYLINNSVLQSIDNIKNLNGYDFVYGNVKSPEYGDKYDGEFDKLKIIDKNICHQALFVRKDLFLKIGVFNIKYRQLADYDFNLRCMFNDKVKKLYVDIMIAYYSPGGASSKIVDTEFVNDKNILLLKYGYKYFTWTESIKYSLKILKYNFLKWN